MRPIAVAFFDVDGVLLEHGEARDAGLATVYRAGRARRELDERAFLGARSSLGAAFLGRASRSIAVGREERL